MEFTVDYIVIGAGAAGSAAAAELAAHGKVALLEREGSPGYHSTGRSAAVFASTYGNNDVRALTRASYDMFFSPPPGLTQAPLVLPRRVLLIAGAGREAALDAYLADIAALERPERKTVAEVIELCPILRPDAVSGGALGVTTADIEVHELQQMYLRQLKTRGGALNTDAEVRSLTRCGDLWVAETPKGSFSAPIVVNVAGAWAGQIGAMAGALDIGLQPTKRTVCLLEAPEGTRPEEWPMLVDAEERFYLKPDAGLLLLSAAEETPVEPSDAQPDDLDVAIAIDRLEAATTLVVKRIRHKWAGLRSFVPDRSPVVGFDPIQPGFFWIAALGGFGIQTAPALGRLAAALIVDGTLPQEMADAGIDLSTIAPRRLARGDQDKQGVYAA